jgi:SNF2 family DNA or RNA helicase
MLLSLKAGGVGLNLTSANHLLLLDPAWNPAVEWQCFDRIHRMGQTKDVFIYKFITKDDSIEETMLEIQRRKHDIINGAFHMPDDERRRQRIDEILTIFNLQT